MSRHSNAVGYLLELRDQEVVPWFSKICDIAISSDGRPLSEEDLQSLLKILIGQEHYTPISATPIPPSTTTTTLLPCALTLNHLKELSGFSNFKMLSDELKVIFDKRVTLIFGCNGSGKTSLCEAIKLLASPENPNNPLYNVRAQIGQASSFRYHFENDPNPLTWDPSQGHGIYADRIKYYDSTIAIQNITDSVVPERVVKIEPFRLEIFNYAGQFIRRLNEHMSNLLSTEREKLSGNIELIKTTFNNVVYAEEKAISNLSISNCAELEQILSIYSGIEEAEKRKHEDNIKSLNSLVKARSSEGLKLQQTEFKILIEYGHSLKNFIKRVQSTSLKKAIDLTNELSSKKSIQQDLAKNITPEGVDPLNFEQFIKSSEKILKYESLETESCPFCRRSFDKPSLVLIKKYHEFLLDKVGEEIQQIEADLKNCFSSLKIAKDFSLPSISSTIPLSQEILDSSESCIEKNQKLIPNKIEDLKTAEHEGYGELVELKKNISLIAREVLQRYRAIKLSSSSEEEFQKHCNKLKEKINLYNYKKHVDENFAKLKDVVTLFKFCVILENIIQTAGFSGYLRKVTNKGKEAYRDLVVSEFERAVDDEYKRMSGLRMSDFGITLTSTGAEQTVIVDTKIGDEPINRVFSEGEQKIHSLSLFFSEATISNHHIVVFDDPVTSFDYNYSAKYAERLRDYIRENPDIQVIVLTHNWDFFVHIQIVINQSGLNNQTSVKVLEHCCIVEEYSEKIDDLKNDIAPIISNPGEPSRSEKDRLAGYLRRLIESVVNKYVFNGQRHQFKQTTMSVSVFNNYTRLVSLLPSEATKLRDLYRNLSVPEHEDPRNYYSRVSKAMYVQFYTDICDIENALIARKP
jgi:DNA repair exonuclease SbcCD ATPase subunit